MSNKRNCLKAALLKGVIITMIIHFGNSSFAQSYEWEIDKHKRREQQEKRELDSLLVHLKNNWQLSLSYGLWHFDNSAQSQEVSLLAFPRNMGAWNLSFARYLSEYLSVKVSLGVLAKKIEPSRPDIFSVLGGANVEVEGGGIFLMPISAGMNCFFLKQRFRPYTGLSVGIVPVKYKYIEASGNVSNGISRNEYEFNSRATFAELSFGFIYRTTKKVQLGLNCDYVLSKDFSENIGGYKAYNGIETSLMFSYVF